MANRTALFASDTLEPPTAPPEDAWLEANYAVPILWLSLFSTADLVVWPGTLDDEPYTALAGEWEPCVRRSAARLAAWRLRWQTPHGDLATSWLEFLAASDPTYLCVWTEEICWMFDEEPLWSRTIRSFVEGLDRPSSPGFREAMNHSSVSVNRAGQVLPTNGTSLGVVAAGCSGTRPGPWE